MGIKKRNVNVLPYNVRTTILWLGRNSERIQDFDWLAKQVLLQKRCCEVKIVLMSINGVRVTMLSSRKAKKMPLQVTNHPNIGGNGA